MLTIEPISSKAIPRALGRAGRYRPLNEPRQQERICGDAPSVDPGRVAHEWIARAMHRFEQAQTLAPAANDDAVLRWNTCVPFLTARPKTAPRAAYRDIEAAHPA